MSFWDRLFGREQRETKAYTVLDLLKDYQGQGASVSAHTALQSIAIMRCVSLLSGIISTFPVDVFSKQDGRRVEIDHGLERILNDEANPDMDATTFRETMMANLLLSGNACATKVMTGNRVVALWPIDWRAVSWVSDGGDLVYTVQGPGGEQRKYRSAEIFRVSLMSMDGIHGLSPIEQVKVRLSGHKAAEDHQAFIYRNKAMPGMIGMWDQDPGAEGVEQLKAQMEQYRGEGAGKTLILVGARDVKWPAIPMTDLQYIESLQYGEEQIARLYGVPPHILGLTSKQSNWGTGIEQSNIGFCQYTLGPLCARWESAIRKQLLSKSEKAQRVYVKHNMAALLRGDLKTQAETLGEYVRGGLMSPNEGRAKLDLNPYTGGDEHYMQEQMTPVRLLGKKFTEEELPNGTD